MYLAIVGGAAALETMQIEEIEAVWWEDLMPECLWKFRVREFGPLIVAIDAQRPELVPEGAGPSCGPYQGHGSCIGLGSLLAAETH